MRKLWLILSGAVAAAFVAAFWHARVLATRIDLVALGTAAPGVSRAWTQGGGAAGQGARPGGEETLPAPPKVKRCADSAGLASWLSFLVRVTQTAWLAFRPRPTPRFLL